MTDGRPVPTRTIDGLADLDGRFDALLCDIWGVVHNGGAVHPGVAEALTAVRRSGRPVVLVSNVPRASSTIPRTLLRRGLPDDAYDAIVTSGDATRQELARRSPGPVHRLGRETDTSLWEGLGLEFTGLGPARFLAMAGLLPGQHPDDYGSVLRAAHVRDLELVCANPDLQVPDGAGLAWCAGSVAQRYAALGGRVVMSGKPEAAIYARARSVIDGVAGRSVAAARILAVGDGIGTDVRGANRSGLTCLFIATGLNGDTLLDATGAADPVLVQRALSAAGARADYVMTSLA
jgi:HAD superfamily hydrolase (TIGR01459 family)